MSHIICSSLQTSSSSNIVSCDGTGDTFHEPTGVGSEYSPPDLSNSPHENRQSGGSLASEDSNSEDASKYIKKRKLGAALYSIHLQERHMLTRRVVEFVEERTTSLIRWSLLDVRGQVLDTLRSSGLDIDDQVPIIEEIFDKEMNPFEGIDSNWQKEQFIKQHFPYVVSNITSYLSVRQNIACAGHILPFKCEIEH